MSSTDYTKLTVTNTSTETVEVFVTFAADNPNNQCCPTPAAVGDFPFLTEMTSLRGKFSLAAGKSQEFDPQGKCFSGNIGFYIEPKCPVEGANFHHGAQGTNIGEFTLNPNQPCYEAFDVSCVNGINCYMQMSVDQDDWYYGPDNTPITSIQNNALQQNSGNPGVYPVNCTDCVRLVGAAPCSSLPVGPAQTSRICNVQRSGRGGTLTITLLPDPTA
ncbi:MAG TPA: hypothetical protein DCS93_40860 [Microscillaceae bacterium]|nr:hypothetical protein [Microscillaceae bacterium]